MYFAGNSFRILKPYIMQKYLIAFCLLIPIVAHCQIVKSISIVTTKEEVSKSKLSGSTVEESMRGSFIPTQYMLYRDYVIEYPVNRKQIRNVSLMDSLFKTKIFYVAEAYKNECHRVKVEIYTPGIFGKLRYKVWSVQELIENIEAESVSKK